MTFASPWYLLGLLGIAIPIVLHLIRRQRAERVVLPTARFLNKAPQKTVFFQTVQHWLLMALRAAIVALLAIGFARPLIIGAAPEMTGVKSRSVVILLDTSMSMRYADQFEAGKAAVIQILGSLKSGDEAAIIAFADRPGLMKPLTTDLGELQGFLRGIDEPGYGNTLYPAALRAADQMLRGARYRDRSIYLVSDYRKGALPNRVDTWQLSPGLRLDLVNVGSARTGNLAITGGHLHQRSDQYNLVARIENRGTEPVSEARVSLALNGSRVAERTVRLQAGSETRVEFALPLDQTGQLNGTLTLAGDRFEADNVYYFTFRIEPPHRVLVVNAGSAGAADVPEAHWLRSALQFETESTFRVDLIDPARLRPETLASYAAVVMLNAGDISIVQADALEAYVKGGGGLLLAPAERADSKEFNQDYRDLTPALLTQKQVHSDGTTLAITRVQEHHPLVRSLFSGRPANLEDARFHGYWSTAPVPRAEVIMRFDNGQAALVGQRVGSGRVLLFTSSLDPQWNDFPLQVSYLPLLHEAMRYLSGVQQVRLSYRSGDSVPLAVPPDGAVRVISPAGEDRLLRSGLEGYAFYSTADLPGFYEVRSGSRTRFFAVNVNAPESDLRPMDPDIIRTAVLPDEAQPEVAAADAVAKPISAPTDTDRFWWWILLAVFGLGLLETFIANRTYR